jgi:hypothetical protein
VVCEDNMSIELRKEVFSRARTWLPDEHKIIWVTPVLVLGAVSPENCSAGMHRNQAMQHLNMH